MNCIKAGDLQKYIDREATPEEMAAIESHLELCEKCAHRFKQQRKIASGVKKALNLLVEGPSAVQASDEIPEYTGIPDSDALPGRQRIRRITGRRMLYVISAACIAVLVWFLAHRENPRSGDEIIYTLSLDWEYDANRTVSQQPMDIEMIDPESKLVGYPIEN